VVPNGEGHIVSVVESFGKAGKFDGFPVIAGPVGVILTMLWTPVGAVGLFSVFREASGCKPASAESLDPAASFVLVVLIVLGAIEREVVGAFHATQRTWPMVILQLAFRVGFMEYNCASVIPNFVQIK
jgi:hypothetical protein